VDKLQTQLPGLPLILAGPILRRVTDSSVTVWVALQKAANVTLQVRSAAGASAGDQVTQPTIAVGRFLHIVAVTAQVSLTPGVIYPSYALPSFALPPAELNDLRILHGSCSLVTRCPSPA
jgi:hypothetical protein